MSGACARERVATSPSRSIQQSYSQDRRPQLRLLRSWPISEALKIQVRLAGRLQAAGLRASRSSWLAVVLQASLHCRLAQSGEFFHGLPCNPCHTQAWFLIACQLCGGLVGVVDLAGLLGSLVQRTEQMLSESELVGQHGVGRERRFAGGPFGGIAGDGGVCRG